MVDEVIKGIQSSKARNVLSYHYRTKAGAKIDLVLSGSFGTVPIKIKYSSMVRRKQITSLIKFIEMHKLPLGLVISNCETPFLLTDKIVQIPATVC